MIRMMNLETIDRISFLTKRDSRGRLLRWDSRDPETRDILTLSDGSAHIAGHGHAACSVCGKDMPDVWETVCFVCHEVFCYQHVHVEQGKWVCEADAGNLA